MTRLGQHFLSDPRILARIADALDCAPGETVIEIGPGHGALTRELLTRGVQVIAIEKDRALAGRLEEWAVGSASLRVVEGDALRLDWFELSRKPSSTTPHSPLPAFKVIGNIPYNITSPLLAKAMTPPLPERIVFLVQAEVAERIAAQPGGKTYGALSVGVQVQCRVEQLFRIAPGAFRPPPKVHSALIRLTPLAEPLVTPDEVAALRAFVTACFSKRRKQLKNVVAGIDLERLGFDPTMRPERVSPEGFVRLLRAHPLRLLFLCTGNSARSQMAEAILNAKGRGRFEAASAGSRPAARVNPYAIEMLREFGIPWSGHPPRSVDGLEREHWDYVITVCDRAKEACPIFPGHPVLAHWGMPDPADVEGDDATKRAAFREAFLELSRRIDLLLALPALAPRS